MSKEERIDYLIFVLGLAGDAGLLRDNEKYAETYQYLEELQKTINDEKLIEIQ